MSRIVESKIAEPRRHLWVSVGQPPDSLWSAARRVPDGTLPVAVGDKARRTSITSERIPLARTGGSTSGRWWTLRRFTPGADGERETRDQYRYSWRIGVGERWIAGARQFGGEDSDGRSERRKRRLLHADPVLSGRFW